MDTIMCGIHTFLSMQDNAAHKPRTRRSVHTVFPKIKAIWNKIVIQYHLDATWPKKMLG